MSPWHPMATAPRDGRWVIVQLSDGQEQRARFLEEGLPFGGFFDSSGDYIHHLLEAWRPAPAPACAACGVPASQARLGPAGSEYWPERRAELTCDACAERLTLAAERFRRTKGWTALQERLSNAWPIPGAHFLASDHARRRELQRRLTEIEFPNHKQTIDKEPHGNHC